MTLHVNLIGDCHCSGCTYSKAITEIQNCTAALCVLKSRTCVYPSCKRTTSSTLSKFSRNDLNCRTTSIQQPVHNQHKIPAPGAGAGGGMGGQAWAARHGTGGRAGRHEPTRHGCEGPGRTGRARGSIGTLGTFRSALIILGNCLQPHPGIDAPQTKVFYTKGASCTSLYLHELTLPVRASLPNCCKGSYRRLTWFCNGLKTYVFRLHNVLDPYAWLDGTPRMTHVVLADRLLWCVVCKLARANSVQTPKLNLP